MNRAFYLCEGTLYECIDESCPHGLSCHEAHKKDMQVESVDAPLIMQQPLQTLQGILTSRYHPDLPILSGEQAAIVDAFSTSNIIVDAVAGSGKTTTILSVVAS
jgi:hypothetical protein